MDAKTRITFTTAELDALVHIVDDANMTHDDDAYDNGYSTAGVTITGLLDKLIAAQNRVARR